MTIKIYRWFARKAAKQRMIKMNTMTLTRQLKNDEMISGFQLMGNFNCRRRQFHQVTSPCSLLGKRQVGPV